MDYSMVTAAADVIILAFQQYIQAWFIAKFIRTKKATLFIVINVLLYSVGYLVIQNFVPDMKGIIQTGLVLTTVALTLVFRQRSVVISILYPILFDVCLMVLDYLSVLMYNAILPEQALSILNASFSADTPFPTLQLNVLLLLRATGVVQNLLAGLAAYYALRGRKNEREDFDKRINQFIPIFILEFVFIGFLMVYTSRIVVSEPNIMWLMVAILVIFYILDALVWYILSFVENSEKLRREKMEMALIAETNAAAYRQITESSIRFSSLRHDLINQLQTAGILIQNGETENASKLLLSYSDSVRNSGRSITGNSIVDAIISIKEHTCADAGITLDVEGKIPNRMQLDDSDLCSVVGNMLDNAVHAAVKCENREGSHIRFSACIRDNKLVFTCKNPTNEFKVKETSNLNPENEHGWGMYILDKIAMEHGGSFTLIAENGEASAVFWIPVSINGDKK